MVEATLNYMAEMSERPYYYLYEPPAGTPWRNNKGDRHQLAIHDARDLVPAPSLDREGFELGHFESAAANLHDGETIRGLYYREVERLVRGVTGAVRVLAFDHNLRSAAKGESESGVQTPVRYAHNDYTERSGPQRVRELLGSEAQDLLRRRFAVVNVWKPIRGPVYDAPLAVCDARTITPDDFLPTELRYRDRTGEVYSLKFNPAHRWFYFSRMQPDEVMLLKCFDSDARRARFTAHSAFDDPNVPAGAPPRQSIEVRTLAFFA